MPFTNLVTQPFYAVSNALKVYKIYERYSEHKDNVLHLSGGSGGGMVLEREKSISLVDSRVWDVALHSGFVAPSGKSWICYSSRPCRF